jgi:ADP-ribose pyrophosphatase
VDDPRNTDNAWMETVALHFHCSRQLGDSVQLHAGDDAGNVQWLTIDEKSATYQLLYASHKTFVDLAVANFRRALVKVLLDRSLARALFVLVYLFSMCLHVHVCVFVCSHVCVFTYVCGFACVCYFP